MKKNIFLLLLLMVSISGYSQIKLGVKGGLAISTLSKGFEFSSKPSFYAGVYAEFFIMDKLAIQPEVVYSRQGAARYAEGYFGVLDLTVTQRINYLNFPIMIRYHFLDIWSVEIGPQLGVKLNSKLLLNDTKENDSGLFKKSDLGLAIGTSYHFTKNISINTRYNIGLTNILNSAGIISRNNVFQLGITVNM